MNCKLEIYSSRSIFWSIFRYRIEVYLVCSRLLLGLLFIIGWKAAR